MQAILSLLKTMQPVWLKNYQRDWLNGDLSASLIVTVMLIPQSLAYAMLAGLPPQYGMYASLLPLIAYALLGTSSALAVGPVAVISLMTANALAPLATAGSAQYIELAITLAWMSGLILLLMGLFKLGALSQLLSHPVIAGFINGSALLIALGQLKSLLGLSFSASHAPDMLVAIFKQWQQIHGLTAWVGLGSLAALLLARRLLKGHVARLAPMLVVILTIAGSQWGNWQAQGVKVVGKINAGLPSLAIPSVAWADLQTLLLPALLISLVGMVESISVASSLAQKRQERIAPNREFLALGLANVASACSAGYPVTGGFARSVVNFAAGARSPLAGVLSAVWMAMVLMGFTHWFYHLPQTVLAATIMVAVLSLIDLKPLQHAWHFDRSDAYAFLVTLFGVLIMGVEEGILLGVFLSLASLVYKSSRPHMALLGRVEATEHFRNIERHQVQTLEHTAIVRIDENIFFGNSTAIESRLLEIMETQDQLQHLVLVMAAVNRIDSTGLDMLDQFESSLSQRGIALHLSEVKGPVMDALKHTPFFERLQHRNHLSTHLAWQHVQDQSTVVAS